MKSGRNTGFNFSENQAKILMMKFFNFRAAKIIFFIESQNPGQDFRHFQPWILEFLYFGRINLVVSITALLDLHRKNLNENLNMKKY